MERLLCDRDTGDREIDREIEKANLIFAYETKGTIARPPRGIKSEIPEGGGGGMICPPHRIHQDCHQWEVSWSTPSPPHQSL